jgi:Mrp family chromosome partitioning ATPase
VGAEVLPLASFVDKVVFVVRWGETPRDDVMNAIKQLTEARSDFAGIVLSRVNPKRYGTYAYATANFTYGTTVVTRLG